MKEDCVLVTGGAGFIGCAVSNLLPKGGVPFVAFDNLLEQVHPSQDRPGRLAPEAVLFRADVRSSSAWDEFLERYSPTIVLHLAAETGTAQSLSEASRHASVNVTGTTEMLDAFVRAGVRPKKVILASSRAVYGEGKWQGTDGEFFYPTPRSHEVLAAGKWSPLDSKGHSASPLAHAADDVFPQPTSIYGATKLAQEHVLEAWCGAFSIPLVILRLQNVYGVGQSPLNPYTGIINIFHRIARTGQTIEVYEDGNIGRDFVYIDDVAKAFCAAMGADIAAVTRIDVGLGERVTIHDAARIIARMHAAPEPVVTGKFRDGDIRSAVADVRKLKKVLGVNPATNFENGAKWVGDWLVENGFA